VFRSSELSPTRGRGRTRASVPFTAQLVCPPGTLRQSMSTPAVKYAFAWPIGRNSNRASVSRARRRGVSRSSRTLGAGCDGRWRAPDESALCGRLNHVVLIPRRWNQVGRMISADDGDKKPGSPGRARHRPLKPTRRECRLNPSLPVVTTLVCSSFFAREAAGAAGTRHSLRPPFSEGCFLQDPGDGIAAAGMRRCA
jgi:hypothetical protein